MACNSCLDCNDITVPTGATGASGPQGPAGANGADGTNGVAIIQNYNSDLTTSSTAWDSLANITITNTSDRNLSTSGDMWEIEAAFKCSTGDSVNIPYVAVIFNGVTYLGFNGVGFSSRTINLIRFYITFSRVTGSTARVETKVSLYAQGLSPETYIKYPNEFESIDDLTGLDFTNTNIFGAYCNNYTADDVTLKFFRAERHKHL